MLALERVKVDDWAQEGEERELGGRREREGRGGEEEDRLDLAPHSRPRALHLAPLQQLHRLNSDKSTASLRRPPTA